MSDSGASVRFGKFFWDTADNTRNPTRVSESDTDAGCLTRQKILDTGVRKTQLARGWGANSTFQLCDQQDETASHLVINCKSVTIRNRFRTLWQLGQR
uniref:Uncharacterized protein n=1 Tax=Arundo donax TaxID=35708 RepID=A0A0A9D395_ARUDO